MSSADVSPPASQAGIVPVEQTRHDPGLGAERTRLAWRRTALAATVCELLAIRQAANTDGNAVTLLGAALSLLCWLGLLWVASRRVVAMTAARPVRLERLATGLVSCCVGLAAAGVMLILG